MRRGVRIALTLASLLLFIIVAGGALIYFSIARGPAIPNEAVLVLRPGGTFSEVAPNDLFNQLVSGGGNTLRGYIDALRKARRDPRVTAVLLMPSALESPYWGKLQELRDAMLEFRKSGKKVIAFLEYGGDREYFLASAADQVFLVPTSPLDLTGVASYEIFLRGTFDKIGTVPDFLRIGDYKTAPNQLTETAMTRRIARCRPRSIAMPTISWSARSPRGGRRARATFAR